VKVLFFGTPEVAVPFLEWLMFHQTVVGVVCRPDQPVGRGYKLTSPPTKIFGQTKGVPIFQPVGHWSPDTVGKISDTKADVGVVVAYGRILPKAVFMAPRLGSINIHFSLLPKYRGAAPMQWSLIRGETKTGVTAFWLEEGLDSGPICRQKEIPIEPSDDTVTLRQKLIPVGIQVLEQVFKDLEAGRIIKNPQEGAPTLAPQLTKETGQIQWKSDAPSIVNLVRGVREWPGAATRFSSQGGSSKQLKIFKAEAHISREKPKTPGTILAADQDQGIVVQAGQGLVLVKQLQPEGKKEMSAWSFWQGARLEVGAQLG
jgi:methionyl-tRNA formyltransferase